jgi:hypothetical protein
MLRYRLLMAGSLERPSPRVHGFEGIMDFLFFNSLGSFLDRRNERKIAADIVVILPRKARQLTRLSDSASWYQRQTHSPPSPRMNLPSCCCRNQGSAPTC